MNGVAQETLHLGPAKDKCESNIFISRRMVVSGWTKIDQLHISDVFIRSEVSASNRIVSTSKNWSPAAHIIILSPVSCAICSLLSWQWRLDTCECSFPFWDMAWHPYDLCRFVLVLASSCLKHRLNGQCYCVCKTASTTMSNCPFSSVLIFSVRCRTCFECSVMITVNGHGMNMDEPFSSIFIHFLNISFGTGTILRKIFANLLKVSKSTVSHILVLPFWLELLPLQVWLRFSYPLGQIDMRTLVWFFFWGSSFHFVCSSCSFACHYCYYIPSCMLRKPVSRLW